MGAAIGSTIGKLVDPQPLTLLFAIAMVAVAASMWRPRRGAEAVDVHLTPQIAMRAWSLLDSASGFFGIGGGFLMVPGLILGSGMPMLNPVGSSLLAVAVFGATAAVNYPISGLVIWPIAGWMLAGGLLSGAVGVWASRKLAGQRALLQRLFTIFVLVVAAYVGWRAIAPI